MSSYKKHNPIELIAFSLLYITIGLFGTELVSIEKTSLTMVWLPAGFGAVMAIRFGYKGIATVFFSSFVVNAPLYFGDNSSDLFHWLPVTLIACSIDSLQSFLVMFFYNKYRQDLFFSKLNIPLIRAVSSIFLLPTLFTSWILLIMGNHLFGFLDGTLYTLLKNYIPIFIADTAGIFLVLSLLVAFPQWRTILPLISAKGTGLLFSFIFIPLLATLHEDFMYLSFIPLLLLTYFYHHRGAVLGIFVLNLVTILLVTSGILSFGDLNRTYEHTLAFIFSTWLIFYLMSILFSETEEKAKLLIQQSKMATMGEMINAISHQWKQPLSATYFFVELIQEKLDSKKQKDEDINNLIDKIIIQLEQMDTTITDFRDFLKPTNKTVDFKLNEVINEVYHLNEAKFHYLNIEFQVYGDKEVTIYGNPNEMKQALLNIYSNAANALEESGNQNKNIDVYIEKERSTITLRICDNAGGIKENLLPDKLFKSYISTKADKGTGIGLYISKTIIEKSFCGTIWAHNIDRGAEFVIEIPNT